MSAQKQLARCAVVKALARLPRDFILGRPVSHKPCGSDAPDNDYELNVLVK